MEGSATVAWSLSHCFFPALPFTPFQSHPSELGTMLLTLLGARGTVSATSCPAAVDAVAEWPRRVPGSRSHRWGEFSAGLVAVWHLRVWVL